MAAGTLFGFAPGRFAQISHPQLLNFFWAPIALLYLDRFIHSRRWRDLWGFAIFYWLQVLSSIYLGYMLTMAIAVYVAYAALVVDRTLLRPAMLTKVLSFVGASLVVLLPVHLPYLDVSHLWGISLGYDELIHSDAYVYLSAEPLNYLSVPTMMAEVYRSLINTSLPAAERVGIHEKLLFPGLVLPALSLLGSVGKIESVDATRVVTLRRSCWLILGLGLALSLGPFLVIMGRRTGIPLPYLLFFYVIPGFRVVRAPARFALLVVLAAAPLAALGVLRLGELGRRLTRTRLTAYLLPSFTALALMTLALLEIGLKPLPLAEIMVGEERLDVYRWLAEERPGPIVEVPIGFLQEYEYLYNSTFHWLPRVNGMSGYIPPTFWEIKRALESLPTQNAVEYLKAIGVKAVVVHTDRLRADEADRWNESRLAQSGLEAIGTFGATRVYRVPLGTQASRLSLELDVPEQLPPGAQVRLWLSVRAESGHSWRHPQPHEISPYTLSTAQVEWDALNETKVLSHLKIKLPFVILADENAIIPMSIETPRMPGTYTLRLSLPSLAAETAPQRVTIPDVSPPTSATAPDVVSATYVALPQTMPDVVTSRETISVTIRAENTGRAIWLADAGDGHGTIQLGWRWSPEGQTTTRGEGRTSLLYDTFPGQSSTFHASINPPEESGLYVLELGLVNEHLGWLSDQGVPPLRFSMRVEQTASCAYPDQLAEVLDTTPSESPRIRLFTDRSHYQPGQEMHLFLKPDHVPKSFTSDVYLVLRRENCRLDFFEFDRPFIEYHGGLWPIFFRNFFLAQARDAPRILLYRLPIMELTSGTYQMALFFTVPNDQRVIARTHVSFPIEP